MAQGRAKRRFNGRAPSMDGAPVSAVSQKKCAGAGHILKPATTQDRADRPTMLSPSTDDQERHTPPLPQHEIPTNIDPSAFRPGQSINIQEHLLSYKLIS